VKLAALAIVAALAGSSGSHHARLIPSGFAPFKVKGTGFHARERVRLTVTPSTRPLADQPIKTLEYLTSLPR
jgi:hypothetical protein